MSATSDDGTLHHNCQDESRRHSASISEPKVELKEAEKAEPQQARDKSGQSKDVERSLFRRFLPVFLIALQFGMDSTLWLPTAYAHIAQLTTNSTQTSHYLSIAQLLPAAVQLVVSLLIGPLAASIGSLKWPTCLLLLCSAVGNFVYSCAAPHAIHNVWAIVGARCLVGLASGSASLAMAYLTVSTTADRRLEAMSHFRTFGGIAMVLGPLLSIPLTRVQFQVGGSAFRVDGTNAPTFLAAFTSLIIPVIVALLLKDRSKPAHNAFAPLMGFFTSQDGRWKLPCLVLGLMLVSAYLSANTLFLLSDLLGHRWNIGITLASGIQAIVFALSLMASITCGRLRQVALAWSLKRSPASLEDGGEQGQEVASSQKHASSSPLAKMRAEVLLTQASQIISVAAALLGLISLCFARGLAGTAVLFAIACTVSMAGYNIQAVSLPSLFSQSLPSDVRASLVPWYAATVAAGKQAAPPVTEGIANSYCAHGWPASQSVPLVLGLGAVVVLALASNRLVSVCGAQSSK